MEPRRRLQVLVRHANANLRAVKQLQSTIAQYACHIYYVHRINVASEECVTWPQELESAVEALGRQLAQALLIGSTQPAQAPQSQDTSLLAVKLQQLGRLSDSLAGGRQAGVTQGEDGELQ